MRVTGWILVAVALIAAAAIYVELRDGGESYSLTPTATCLRGQGFDVQTGADSLDMIAESSSAGALAIEGNAGRVVEVAFDRTEEDAQRQEAAWRMFGAGLNVPVDDVLARHGNAVLVWTTTPSTTEKDRVAGCLR